MLYLAWRDGRDRDRRAAEEAARSDAASSAMEIDAEEGAFEGF